MLLQGSRRAAAPLLSVSLLVAATLPMLRPAESAPTGVDNPSGKWVGTWNQDGSMLSGTATLTIGKLKPVTRQFPEGPFLWTGKFDVGGRKGKVAKGLGNYTPNFRAVSGSNKAGKKPTLVTGFTLNLSQDGQTLSGRWGRNLVPGGGENVQGDLVLTRQ